MCEIDNNSTKVQHKNVDISILKIFVKDRVITSNTFTKKHNL